MSASLWSDYGPGSVKLMVDTAPFVSWVDGGCAVAKELCE